MARYREKILSLPAAAALVAFAFLISFSPWNSGEIELSWREGYVAAQTLGMDVVPLPLAKAHGEALPNAYPLFPMLAKLANVLGCPADQAPRAISLLGLAGLVILVFAVAAQTRNNISAGACAAAVMISSILLIDKAPEGLANTIFVLVIFAGQLIWYNFAALRGDWSKAWIAGFTACAVGFYINGIYSLIFFLLPLVFMRRPLGIFRHLGNRGMILGIGIFALVTLLWYLPYHFDGVIVAQAVPRLAMLVGWDYLWHLLCFPWDFALRMLPWALLAWSPFCVAIQTLDDTPMFSRFLRTLFLANFFLLWITPLDEVNDWLILVPPLAVMTGLNYELTVRRYGNTFRKLGNIFAAVLMPGAGVLLLGFFLLPAETLNELVLNMLDRSIDFNSNFGRKVLGVTSGGVLLLLALILWRMRTKPPIWCYYLIIAMAPLLVYYNIVLPYQAQERPRYDRAEILARALEQDGAPAGVLIYKYNINDLFTESVYMKNPVRKLSTLNNLPGEAVPTVYLFAPSFPDNSQRSWRSLLPRMMKTRNIRFNLWRGDWKKVTVERKTSPLLEEIRRNSAGGQP